MYKLCINIYQLVQTYTCKTGLILELAFNVVPELFDKRSLVLLWSTSHKQIDPAINGVFPFVSVSADNEPASLLQDDPACAHVPHLAASFPVGVELARGHMADIHCGRAKRSEPVDEAMVFVQQRPESLHLDVEQLAVPVRATFQGNDRALEGQWLLGQLWQQRAIQVRSLARNRTEHELQVRVVDDPHSRLFVHTEAQRDTGIGEVVNEIGGAINWVHNERWRVSKLGRTFHIRLFTNEQVVWVLCTDLFRHNRLHQFIDCCNQINRVLLIVELFLS